MSAITKYSQAGDNRNQQKFGIDAVRRRLMGTVDPRGTAGILSRGRNIYPGGATSAHRGGGLQFGRPKGTKDMEPLKSAINRRLAQGRRRATPYGR